MARTRKIRGGGPRNIVTKIFRKKKVPAPQHKIRTSERLSKKQREQMAQTRKRLLSMYPTLGTKKFVTIKKAKSPEILHALVTDLSPLPFQPLLKFDPDETEPIPMYEETQVYYDKEKKFRVQPAIRGTSFELPPEKADAEALILHEALNPSGIVYIETPRHDQTRKDDPRYEENDDTNAEDFTIKTTRMYIHPTIAEAVREDYTGIEKFNIPIFMAIEDKNIDFGHMSILVMHQTIIYSLGFGYSGAKSDIHSKIPYLEKIFSKGAFYNPDYIINPKKIVSPNARHETHYVKNYRIIDIGYMQPKHLAKINELIVHCDDEVSANFRNKYFKSNMINTKKEYHGFSCRAISATSVIPGLKGQGRAMNCTTFIEHIFGDRINCSAIKSAPFTPSFPSFCRRIAGELKSSTLKKWFDEYSSDEHEYSPDIHNVLLGF